MAKTKKKIIVTMEPPKDWMQVEVLGRYPELEDLGWLIDNEADAICRNLVERFDYLKHIDMNQVLVLVKEGKVGNAGGGRKAVARCYAVKYPFRALHPYRTFLYMVVVYADMFYRLELKARQIVLFHELMHIPREFDGSGVVPHSIEDFLSLVDALGPNWVETPEEGLPDLLKERLENTYGPLFHEREEENGT